MEIGKPGRTFVIEPVEDPVPRERPDQPPVEEPAVVPQEPERVPA